MLSKKKGTSITGQHVNVFTDGRVHATVYTLSQTAVGDAWLKGDDLDRLLQELQDQGAEIMSVVPYGTGDGKTARCVICYRAPMVIEEV